MTARLPPLRAHRSFTLPRIHIDHFTVIIMATVLFNAGLAFVNANIRPLTSAPVIALEGLIYVYAVAVGCRHVTKQKELWLIFGAAVVGLNVVLGAASGMVDPKLARDVLVIPIFVILGLSATRADVVRVLVRVQWVVLVVMIWEAISPQGFGSVFNIVRYYINTRGFSEEQFWAEGSTLFASAMRPGERFLMGFLNIHRLSSVFLEPVSLGNYCVTVSMIIVALWSYLDRRTRIFLVVSNCMILVGCDGRFATVTILLIITLRWLALRMPRYVNILYLPAALIVVGIGVLVFGLRYDGDTFTGRLVFSWDRIVGMDFFGFVGLTPVNAYAVMDSGVAYLVYSQSIFGVILIWSMIVFGIRYRHISSVVYLHAVCLYIALNLLVSNSLFSVKTAGLLWFTYGVLARDAVPLVLRRAAGGSATPVRRAAAMAGAFRSRRQMERG